MMNELQPRHCTICGPEAPKHVVYEATCRPEDLNAEIFSARRSPDRKHFRLVSCDRCSLIYSDPACDPSKLNQLYEASTVDYVSQEEQIYNSYAPLLDRALPRVRNRGTFLEVGGGRGFMLKYGVQNGFARQLEVEPSADAEKRFEAPGPDARFVRGLLGPNTVQPGSVSMVCFFQMLDHVPDPLAFTKLIWDTLEPGGVVVSATHNTRALSARILGERSPIFDIEHTYLFNLDNGRKLFEKAGFEKVETFSFANRYALRYWWHMAPLPKGLKKTALPVWEKLGLADVKIPLYAGNMALIAQKPLAGAH
jgi:SAM-dependent methyltransferase